MIQEYTLRDTKIWPNVYLSSMSGVSDRAFRIFCKQLARGRMGMLVSEFISVEGTGGVLKPQKIRRVSFSEEERPFCLQLFGHTPTLMGKAAASAQDTGVDFVELNVGCPAPKVTGKGGGAALLKDLPNLQRILKSMREALEIPFLVKIRIGWDEDHINVHEVARMVQDAGAEQLTIHGRHRMQGYRGQANWQLIDSVARELDIPVIGNGDVRTPEDAVKRLNTSACSGVGIGRGALHNPWVFGQVADLWQTGKYSWPTLQEQIDAFRTYSQILDDCEANTMGRLKQLAARFANALENASDFRLHLLKSQTPAEFLERMEEFYEQAACSGNPIRFNPSAVDELNGTQAKQVREGNQFHR